MRILETIGFGGGCHWCTEAVFQAVKGIEVVEQGYISSSAPNSDFSEAIIAHFDPSVVQLSKLIRIHLQTHSSSSAHSMRKKYRSAVYTFSEVQEKEAISILGVLQKNHTAEIITKVLPFKKFEPSAEEFQNYFLTDQEKPFCKTHISPKLNFLKNEYPGDVKN